jgi:hypothetical protein
MQWGSKRHRELLWPLLHAMGCGEQEGAGVALKFDWTRWHGIGGRQRWTGCAVGATCSGIEHTCPSGLGRPLTARARNLFEFSSFSQFQFNRPILKIEKESSPPPKIRDKCWNDRFFSRGTTFLIGQTSNLEWILKYKFHKFLRFEFDFNFKGIQTSWEKISEILQNYDLPRPIQI